MFNTTKISLLSLLIAAAPLSALAQTTEDEAPATEAPAEAPAASQDPASDEPAAVADDGALRVGQPYIREEFGDWSLRCLKSEDDVDPCQLYQLLQDEDGNAVAEVSLFPLPDGGDAAAGATIVVPLETLLTQNLRVTIDAGEPKVYPFTFCNEAGCVARVGFTAAEVTQLQRGNTAVVRMVPAAAPDQEVLLDMSLSGFTAGFNSVNEQ
ncbi:invasion associated locus B family protein [Loktanella sp. SALINAS62]|uniref:invasion associated locus B family protein n=1 Tax=Loktanella sp. SALINAS62 TaxID=2706124 RepID=UPI001B8D816D|nr:invasion associated locus B family protein [Loktanella sp. SALINAS62]MBS1303668.1 invasion associated locus B family protein [Loktanella sp. SALINAS62]